MRVGDFPARTLARRLRTKGVRLNTGAFTTHLRLRQLDIAGQFRDHYHDYTISDDPAVVDFQVTIGPSSAVRRLFRPTVQAYIEGVAPFQPLPARIGFPMLESALNWCVAQRVGRYLLLHAAVVERNGRALILPAPSGSGKSTLCAALTCCGWRLLSDEMTIIRPRDGQLIANPRPIGLKNQSITAIRRFAPSAHLGPEFPGTIKGTVAFMRPPWESVARLGDSAVPRLVIFPEFRTNAATRLDPVEKAQGFMRLVQNSINYHICLKRGFDTLASLVEDCDLYSLTYSDLGEVKELLGSLC